MHRRDGCVWAGMARVIDLHVVLTGRENGRRRGRKRCQRGCQENARFVDRGRRR